MFDAIKEANRELFELTVLIEDYRGVFEVDVNKTIINIMNKFYGMGIVLPLNEENKICTETASEYIHDSIETNSRYIEKLDGELEYIINHIVKDFKSLVDNSSGNREDFKAEGKRRLRTRAGNIVIYDIYERNNQKVIQGEYGGRYFDIAYDKNKEEFIDDWIKTKTITEKDFKKLQELFNINGLV